MLDPRETIFNKDLVSSLITAVQIYTSSRLFCAWNSIRIDRAVSLDSVFRLPPRTIITSVPHQPRQYSSPPTYIYNCGLKSQQRWRKIQGKSRRFPTARRTERPAERTLTQGLSSPLPQTRHCHFQIKVSGDQHGSHSESIKDPRTF